MKIKFLILINVFLYGSVGSATPCDTNGLLPAIQECLGKATSSQLEVRPHEIPRQYLLGANLTATIFCKDEVAKHLYDLVKGCKTPFLLNLTASREGGEFISFGRKEKIFKIVGKEISTEISMGSGCSKSQDLYECKLIFDTGLDSALGDFLIDEKLRRPK